MGFLAAELTTAAIRIYAFFLVLWTHGRQVTLATTNEAGSERERVWLVGCLLTLGERMSGWSTPCRLVRQGQDRQERERCTDSKCLQASSSGYLLHHSYPDIWRLGNPWQHVPFPCKQNKWCRLIFLVSVSAVAFLMLTVLQITRRNLNETSLIWKRQFGLTSLLFIFFYILPFLLLQSLFR